MRSPGFGAGIRSFFEGLAFIVTTPRTWPRAMVPVVTALVLLVGVGWLGVHAAGFEAEKIAGSAEGFEHGFLRVLLTGVAIIVAMLTAIALAQPLSGWALDGLVRDQHGALGRPPLPEHGKLASMARALAINLTGLALTLPLIIGLSIMDAAFPPLAIVGVPLKFVVGGLFYAWDMLDYPLGLRGIGVGKRLEFMWDHFGAVLGFGLSGALFLLLPCVGLFVLPFGVAGAERLALDAEDAG